MNHERKYEKRDGVSFKDKNALMPQEDDSFFQVEFDCDTEMLTPFLTLHPVEKMKGCGKVTTIINERTGLVTDNQKLYVLDLPVRKTFDLDSGETLKKEVIMGHVLAHHSPLSILSPQIPNSQTPDIE